jgi:hypothetical protein
MRPRSLVGIRGNLPAGPVDGSSQIGFRKHVNDRTQVVAKPRMAKIVGLDDLKSPVTATAL